MADNVAITTGAGTTIATDDVGGVHYQRVKLVDGTLEGTGAIGGDAANGLDVDVTRLPAGTNLIGKIASGPDVSNAYDGATALVPKFAKLSTASAGNQALIAAVASKKLRVLSLLIVATASTNTIYINDGTADLFGDSTRKAPLDVTGAAGIGGIELSLNQLGWFETAAVNRPININLGSANGVIAIATYVEV